MLKKYFLIISNNGRFTANQNSKVRKTKQNGLMFLQNYAVMARKKWLSLKIIIKKRTPKF